MSGRFVYQFFGRTSVLLFQIHWSVNRVRFQNTDSTKQMINKSPERIEMKLCSISDAHMNNDNYLELFTNASQQIILPISNILLV